MPVKVEFPDGTVRDVPSHKREIKSESIGRVRRPSVFVDEPDFDAEWRFEPVLGGKWFASPRS